VSSHNQEYQRGRLRRDAPIGIQASQRGYRGVVIGSVSSWCGLKVQVRVQVMLALAKLGRCRLEGRDRFLVIGMLDEYNRLHYHGPCRSDARCNAMHWRSPQD
jgi:hypothetical protein